jgi:hypothetical protein
MASIVYKEWLPDQPELGNPGLLVATNTWPTEGGYVPHRPLDASGATLPAMSSGNGVFSGSTKASSIVYAFGSNLNYYTSVFGTSAFTARGASVTGSSSKMFAQFDDLVIAVGQPAPPEKHTAGSASNFSTLATSGTAPSANVIGIINRFVVVGDIQSGFTLSVGALQSPNVIQWSAIDQPTNWPTPNSATAIATQSGEQELYVQHGAVTGIFGGDQHGVVLQKGAVTRMTYVGPPVVFQFDIIDKTQGQWLEGSGLQAGSRTYFVSRKGFCRTDGVGVENIGLGKVDRFFWDSFYSSGPFSAGYDQLRGIVHFAYSNVTATSTCNSILSFHENTGSWAYSSQVMREFITPNSGFASGATLMAFNMAGTVGKFQATAGSAIFETGEFELNEAGRTFIDGVKPNVESSGTAPSMTVRVGYRDSLGTAPTYTSALTPYTRTGVANMRVDAKYLRLETTITGNFEKATGVEFDAEPAGYA